MNGQAMSVEQGNGQCGITVLGMDPAVRKMLLLPSETAGVGM